MDRFRTDPAFFNEWVGRSPLVGIDEGGPCRASFDYLLDMLPGPKNLTWPVRLLSLSAPALARFSLFRGICRGVGAAHGASSRGSGAAAGSAETANLFNPGFLQIPGRRREDFPLRRSL